ncbi:MAG TPA: type II CAAX endopeptidase family protein [Sphingomonas sp.]
MTDGHIILGSAGVLAPGRWRWLRALGWMLALAAGLVAIALLPALRALVPGRPAWLLPVLMMLATLLSYLAYGGAVRRGERRWPVEIGLSGLSRDLGIGLLIGLAMFTLVFASLRAMGVYAMMPGVWTDWPHDMLDGAIAGLLEELLFRAVLFRLLMRAFGLWWALALSAAIFGALHLANPHATPFAAIAIAIEAGLMLAAFYLLTGRIWMSVGVHAAWNFAQGGIFGASVSGGTEIGSLFVSAPVANAPIILSGGGFGPEASLSAMIVGLGVFLIAMRMASRRGRLAAG